MNEVKKLLGFLIEYERDKKYQGTYSKEFLKETFPTIIVDHQQVTICSSTTYRKLANLEIIKNDDIYELLLNKLGLCYNANAFVYTQVFQEQCKKLIKKLELYQNKHAEKLCEEMLSHMQGDDIIESKYKKALIALKEMLHLGRMLYANDKMKEIVDVFTIYNDEIKQCLEVAVYNYCVTTQQENKINDYFAQIPKTPYHRIHELYYCIDDNRHLDTVKEEMEILLKHYHDNVNQTLNLLIMKMKYYYLIGINSDEAIYEIDSYINTHKETIEDTMITSYWYFKAKKFNREKNYGEAKQWFEKLLQKEVGYIEYVMSYYFHTLVMLDEWIPYDENIGKHLNTINEKIYRYFQIDKNDYLKREEYIMKQLCNDFLCIQEFNARSFLYELRKIVKVTKHYVLLDKYLEKTDVFL